MCLILALQTAVFSKSSTVPPNIIFILADDLGWADVSFRGDPQIPTPNLDVLASQGIILNNYYVQPLCAPSRGALMSGLYPIHTGLQHLVPGPGEPWGLPTNLTIMPEYLKNLGYATHMIGKWHLGYHKESYTPTRRGFDSFYGYLNGGEDYYDHTILWSNASGLDFWENTTPVRNEGNHYSTELFTKKAQSLIKHHDPAKPMFLYFSHQAVHCGDYKVELEAPALAIAHFPYIKELNRSIHAGAVYELDKSVGLVMEALNKRGMLSNSIVIFSTDNGGLPWGVEPNSGYNWPLRGSKETNWEGGARGAAFVWSPLLFKSGRLSNQMMHITDWLPTLYSAAGGNVSTLGNIDGKDMWKALSEDLESPRQEVLINIDPIENSSALIVGRHKVVLGSFNEGSHDMRMKAPGGSRPVDGLDQMMLSSRTGKVLKDFYNVRQLTVRPNWRNEAVVRCDRYAPPNNFVAASPPYYFDLEHDPCELNNLAASNVTELEELIKKIKEYAKGMVPPANKPLDPRGLPKYNHGLWGPWQ
ncbi:arylsulfatase B precursor, putative [Ixodes scapularis]|uniref:Arylsulfatase B, putative n=1 Tax=Ixodes scapularis TaxID=6945 RepID=B7QJZ0_IXOSC|nr:arylsulfatase B precursor, putative [Ixodes scapularis]|eukprot:XP_002415497.1 arylsulfatase B precursor, putative [Ixodes scapularis]